MKKMTQRTKVKGVIYLSLMRFAFVLSTFMHNIKPGDDVTLGVIDKV